jgi:hypothetical protein
MEAVLACLGAKKIDGCSRVALTSARVTNQAQFDGVSQRWITRFCLLLFLVVTSVEAVHVHPDQALSRESSARCLICFSIHAKAPAVTVRSTPALVAVAMIAIPHEVLATGIASRLELFTRPPPAA